MYLGDCICTFLLILFGVGHVVFRTVESIYYKRLSLFSSTAPKNLTLTTKLSCDERNSTTEVRIQNSEPLPVVQYEKEEELKVHLDLSAIEAHPPSRGILLTPRSSKKIENTQLEELQKEISVAKNSPRAVEPKEEENKSETDSKPKKKKMKIHIPKPEEEEVEEVKEDEKIVEVDPKKLVNSGKIQIEVPPTPAGEIVSNNFSGFKRTASVIHISSDKVHNEHPHRIKSLKMERWLTLVLRLFCLVFFALYDGWNIASAVFVFVFGDCPIQSPVLYYSNIANLVLFFFVVIIQASFLIIVVKSVVSSK
jgi:hypothetical protein